MNNLKLNPHHHGRILVEINVRSIQVSNFELVAILDDDIVHMNGLELVEILWKRNEVNCGPLVVLQQLRVIIVPLPT